MKPHSGKNLMFLRKLHDTRIKFEIFCFAIQVCLKKHGIFYNLQRKVTVEQVNISELQLSGSIKVFLREPPFLIPPIFPIKTRALSPKKHSELK